MKTPLTILCCLLLSGIAAAQTISFAYDEAGNRVSRTIVMNSSPSNVRAVNNNADEAETPPPFVEQLSADLQVRIYPNPTKGLLQVELAGLAEDAAASVTVTNLNGQQIISTDAVRSVSTIDLSAYPSGTYVLRLIINGKATEYKIIKN
jgi:YD repeat-containing protein